MTKKKEKFEDYLIRLQKISEELENEDVGLDEAIKLYEEGIKLSKLCHKKLEAAELKISELRSDISIK
jgi:exodeoxyribonuclease VII small subunit